MLCSLLGLFCPQVDAFYYPDRNDLQVYEEYLDVGSIDDCRKIVFEAAARNNDADMERGDYECGVGPTGSYDGIRVYEETLK